MVTGSFIGYANIANQPINGNEDIKFPLCPNWMNRLDQDQEEEV